MQNASTRYLLHIAHSSQPIFIRFGLFINLHVQIRFALDLTIKHSKTIILHIFGFGRKQ